MPKKLPWGAPPPTQEQYAAVEPLIRRLWSSPHSHCMVKGCGQTTLPYWLHLATGVHVNPRLARRVLQEMCRRGRAEANPAPHPDYRTCTRFRLLR